MPKDSWPIQNGLNSCCCCGLFVLFWKFYLIGSFFFVLKVREHKAELIGKWGRPGKSFRRKKHTIKIYSAKKKKKIGFVFLRKGFSV